MKAAILKSINNEIAIEDIATPVPGEDEVVVKIVSAAVNHRDVFIQQGLYGNIQLPCVLGSDAVGTITETGTNVDAAMVGERVTINPTLYWGESEAVQSRKFRILGMPDNGTFAEYVKVPYENVFRTPSHLSDAEAAALPLAGVTAFRALFRQGGFMRGERVLITGIGGGVALMALQLATAVDAQVYVTSSQTEKIEKAVKLGAEGGVNYTNRNWSDNLKNNAGHFDLIVDGAAGDDFGKLASLAAPGGRIVVYGGTAGKINNLSLQRIFWKLLTIKVSTMGTNSHFENMLTLVQEHTVYPVVHTVFRLEKLHSEF
jgi:NADPH:quinone reductase-like Zn-dependent oxidoreductase